MFKEDSKRFDNDYIFAVIFIIERLLTKSDGLNFITNIETLIEENTEYTDFHHLGFPENWKELLEKVNHKKVE
ncbi:hypothetical protein H1Z61_14995 [Bacillus aquiflavi]|uniref:Uncharacterized protein n=1 Tax=Bacillus aquiflavi TaxID=2672567 RepID=A0A6B3VZT1_9BACI|nr:hypothetical protein [Bacillus aquiflavi]MBA4538403.1 hypothetical protein [Bacillus aquiflavi]NEY82768.1 hypothetical protein [Bacillus aquiflavi]UAC48525.1 hypothetical protein K6959_00505 [Bacillus aquiflavi]